MIFNDKLDDWASGVMLNWEHDENRETQISIMGDMLYDADDAFTPLCYVLHAWSGKPLTQEGLKRGLLLIEPKTEHISAKMMRVMAIKGPKKEKITVSGYLMPFSNAIMQARHLLFDGRDWYVEPNKRQRYRPCGNGEVPIPERVMMFWHLMARRASQQLEK